MISLATLRSHTKEKDPFVRVRLHSGQEEVGRLLDVIVDGNDTTVVLWAPQRPGQESRDLVFIDAAQIATYAIGVPKDFTYQPPAA